MPDLSVSAFIELKFRRVINSTQGYDASLALSTFGGFLIIFLFIITLLYSYNKNKPYYDKVVLFIYFE